MNREGCAEDVRHRYLCGKRALLCSLEEESGRLFDTGNSSRSNLSRIGPRILVIYSFTIAASCNQLLVISFLGVVLFWGL